MDLRGRGASDGPSTGRGRRWTFDDYALQDLPAVIEKIRTWTESQQIHLIGHSMGGILTLVYQILHGSEEIKSTTILDP